MTTMTTAKHIAANLLEIGAVHLRPEKPFTWTSGIKSPIYCDNRITMSYPDVRRAIARAFADLIKEQYPDAQVVAGTATAGIPHAAWVAELLDLPMIYVRDKAKGHGRQNQIEGALAAGQKVVVIEDLISTGGSSLKAAQAVQAEGGEVLGVVAIFSYQFPDAQALFEDAGIPCSTISNYTALLEVASEQGVITSEQEKVLGEWRKSPRTFFE
ncbi:orotate phosphoribosyltransferase [Brevibacillus porteri]|uniref:Orotate phosphoribosyltransferase n=1 Tax=Brevibacillus porteri TaxID=2126350 RepID=A0ABX5FUD5_9BACL|nr:orotate phosphoribosyltransferase [Brevibacillus porteri]MED1802571.1 orotate phosphoribosyltransferase [Brevibacillus porteri]MED2134217.1 orotate phosphoribosyltransferase [Brevibacillus porteri]MED2747709.1 orotate phosphoribosyltransferase [Brevibacillus porteri]MED2818142.1 orotate phosphoribosyltransferase [Brevibacillus porteri]MED2892800.1 orotate phosphoribosyltransferase [Brevibacillus porteri]